MPFEVTGGAGWILGDLFGAACGPAVIPDDDISGEETDEAVAVSLSLGIQVRIKER